MIAATRTGMFNSAKAQSTNDPSAEPPASRRGTNTSFATLKHIHAGLLKVGYAETGPVDGRAAILLHGWPYDIHSFVDVAPLLATAGYRVIVPYLRGYGTTRLLSSDTFRNTQQSAVALDIIALMDALKIKSAIIADFDWGALAVRWRRRSIANLPWSGWPYLASRTGPCRLACAHQ